jgi:methionyl aminopeptidase
MIPVKTQQQLQLMRESGRKLSRIMQLLRRRIVPGISTKEIEEVACGLISKEGCSPAFKNYRGFPASICTSVNEEVVHGIPSSYVLKEGDILSIDVGVNFQGYFADAAFTLPVGKIDSDKRSLIEVTKKALLLGIKQAKANNRLSDISYTVQRYVESKGFSVVRQFVGHGIGSLMHEEPEIPNFGLPSRGPLLRKGMVFAIEPMVNMGTWEVEIMDNQWTAITKDRLPSAHFEHTVAITEEGPEILTR